MGNAYCSGTSPALRPGRVCVSALRRPPAGRGGAYRGRVPAGPARAAGARERAACGGAVARAAARAGVTGQGPGGSDVVLTSLGAGVRRGRPPGGVRARAAFGVPRQRGQGCRRSCASESCPGASPFRRRLPSVAEGAIVRPAGGDLSLGSGPLRLFDPAASLRVSRAAAARLCKDVLPFVTRSPDPPAAGATAGPQARAPSRS